MIILKALLYQEFTTTAAQGKKELRKDLYEEGGTGEA